MQHLKARQREVTKVWDFTAEHDGVIYPIGYCAMWEPMTYPANLPDSILSQYNRYKDKHHHSGHKTEQEAIDCYKDYLLDNRFRVSQHEDELGKCEVCGKWTMYRVHVGDIAHAVLCETHATRDAIGAKLSFTEIWEG